jgi:ribosomal 50S subunit-associated protein YjgA (DUF615 family)
MDDLSQISKRRNELLQLQAAGEVLVSVGSRGEQSASVLHRPSERREDGLAVGDEATTAVVAVYREERVVELLFLRGAGPGSTSGFSQGKGGG